MSGTEFFHTKIFTFGSDFSSAVSSKVFSTGLLKSDKAEVVPFSWKLCLLIIVDADAESCNFFNFFWCEFLGREALECFIKIWGFGSTEGGQVEKEVFNPPTGLGGKGGGVELLESFFGDCLTMIEIK